MKTHALRLHAVFNNLEELKEVLQDVVDNAENFGLDNYPNCGCNTHDFDIIQNDNKDVYEFINKLKLSLLLRDVDVNQLSYKDVLDNLNDYINPDDLNYYRVKTLLTKLT